MSKYSDDILEGLTDEERAALEEDESTTTNQVDEGDTDEGEEQGSDAGQAAADDDDDAGEEGEQDGEAGADDGAGGDGDDADDAADDESDAKASDPIVPLLVADAPEDAEAKLKEIGDKKTDLVEQFDNGDITAKEYQSQLDALNKEERAVERAVEKAQLAEEMRKQQEVNAWLGQVRDFTTNVQPEYSTSRVRWMALDAFVKEIGSKPENANLTGAEILRMAHEKVVEDLGAVQPAKAEKPAGKPLKGSKAAPPKTLAKVPAADNADMEDSRWAALDRLRETDPLAHEDRLMKLSDAERDEYLARG